MYEEKIDYRMEIAEKMRSKSIENDYMVGRRYKDTQVWEDKPEESLQRILIKTKILITVFLVGGLIFLDKSDMRIGPLNAGKIFQMIELDYETVMTEKFLSLIENYRR